MKKRGECFALLSQAYRRSSSAQNTNFALNSDFNRNFKVWQSGINRWQSLGKVEKYEGIITKSLMFYP
jgi:hypothetical protein